MGIDSTVWSGRQIETRTTRFLDSVPFYGHKHARFGFRVLVVYANYTEISTISTRNNQWRKEESRRRKASVKRR
jgi:hypothetical protein